MGGRGASIAVRSTNSSSTISAEEKYTLTGEQLSGKSDKGGMYSYGEVIEKDGKKFIIVTNNMTKTEREVELDRDGKLIDPTYNYRRLKDGQLKKGGLKGSSLSRYLKSREEKNIKRFFEQDPNKIKVSNKYMQFNHVIDNDNIIVATRNVFQYIKKDDTVATVLMVGKNKGVYLKDSQFYPAYERSIGKADSGYLVKLNRNNFKTYTFKKDFENMIFEKDQDFNYLKNLAKSQNEYEYHVSGLSG